MEIVYCILVLLCFMALVLVSSFFVYMLFGGEIDEGRR